MSIHVYDRFLEKCDETSCPEFAILKVGVFNRRPNGDRFLRTMRICCELAQARRLLEVAEKICPAAVAEIEVALREADAP